MSDLICRLIWAEGSSACEFCVWWVIWFMICVCRVYEVCVCTCEWVCTQWVYICICVSVYGVRDCVSVCMCVCAVYGCIYGFALVSTRLLGFSAQDQVLLWLRAPAPWGCWDTTVQHWLGSDPGQGSGLWIPASLIGCSMEAAGSNGISNLSFYSRSEKAHFRFWFQELNIVL